MTRDEIIRMALEAGYQPLNPPSFADSMHEAFCVRFATLVEQRAAAAEREACAKVAEQFGWSGECRHVAAAIRARGE